MGLEDVSKYPALVSVRSNPRSVLTKAAYQQIAELYKRGWSKKELEGLTGQNLIRVFEGAEKVAKKLQAAGTQPVYDLYDKRTDIPRRKEL